MHSNRASNVSEDLCVARTCNIDHLLRSVAELYPHAARDSNRVLQILRDRHCGPNFNAMCLANPYES